MRTILCLILSFSLCMSTQGYGQIWNTLSKQQFEQPDKTYGPWTFWYWMHGAVSKPGITKDLEAMRDVGLEGAYLMFIKDTAGSIFNPSYLQLSPEWIENVRFAFKEAKRCGLKLGLHISDGFALAGGPWIKPEMSMQQVVWSKSNLTGGKHIQMNLPLPPSKENFYEDIRIVAYLNKKPLQHSETTHPIVKTSHNPDASFLITGNTETFRADTSAWIEYHFDSVFTARSIQIKPSGNNYQSHRLKILASSNGIDYSLIRILAPSRHGWQDGIANITYSIPETNAKHFRFEWEREGSESASEELDNAKWRAGLKLKGISLSSEDLVDQYESKSGQVWRVASAYEQINDFTCLALKDVIDLTPFFTNGKLDWNAPKGDWTILRIGHTSTGSKNETGGGAKGLECDKFNASAVQLQISNWFDTILHAVGQGNTKDVLSLMHVDSWECGSQNWSSNFASEFKKRRGYDMMPYLPILAGIPMLSHAFSDQYLYDIRATIADLVNDVFFYTINAMAQQRGIKLSAESVAPTMVSDGIRHFQYADYPMGEFWLNSPTHDKPNDMLDAISGAHIYHKNIVQSESFTQLRMSWKEHPRMLKSIGDRNFALGINKIVFHVFSHNPWLDKKPGYTLDGVGLYFQRDQTWFKQADAWVKYITRCQYMLQQGKPVTDIAVFSGEELPSRSILPYKLTSILPGLIGNKRLIEQAIRKTNKGYPGREIPAGVKSNANMEDPEFWVNPLQGYQYDCVNADALPKLSDYSVLVLPGGLKMNPLDRISIRTIMAIDSLLKSGIQVIADSVYKNKLDVLTNFSRSKILFGPWLKTDLSSLGIERDVLIQTKGLSPEHLAFTHRVSDRSHIYFISNQLDSSLEVELSFRVSGLKPELWDPLTGKIMEDLSFEIINNRTYIKLPLMASAAVFIVFNSPAKTNSYTAKPITTQRKEVLFADKWTLQLEDKKLLLDSLKYWSESIDTTVKFYSGTGVYQNTFFLDSIPDQIDIQIEEPKEMATVYLNGKKAGTVWTKPYKLDLSGFIKKGKNELKIEVSNTWFNRILLDQSLPKDQRKTFTTSPIKLSGEAIPSGLNGKIFWEISSSK